MCFFLEKGKISAVWARYDVRMTSQRPGMGALAAAERSSPPSRHGDAGRAAGRAARAWSRRVRGRRRRPIWVAGAAVGARGRGGDRRERRRRFRLVDGFPAADPRRGGQAGDGGASGGVGFGRGGPCWRRRTRGDFGPSREKEGKERG